jgi:hypothetical protein
MWCGGAKIDPHGDMLFSQSAGHPYGIGEES